MTTWTEGELNRVGTEREIEIAPLRRDGTPRKPVTIWVVRLNDNLYVRSWRGRGGAWYRSALQSHEGRIWSGAIENDVSFIEEADANLNDRIDNAYRTKYGQSPYVSSMIAPQARVTTLKLMPRDRSS